MGLVTFAAMGIFAWLIFKVGSAPATLFQPAQIHVTFRSDRADGLGNGANISYKGITVGRISGVERDPETDEITIKASLWKDQHLPANLGADIIFTSPLGAVSTLTLKLNGPKPEGKMEEGAVLEAKFLGSTFLPPEFAELARNVNESVKQFNNAKVLEKLTQTIEETNKDIVKAQGVIDGVNTLVNDPGMRSDLAKSLASIHATAANAEDVSGRIKALSDKFTSITGGAEKAVDRTNSILDKSGKQVDDLLVSAGDKLTKLGATLDNIQSITGKLDKGAGTMGQLINDPKLYAGLVDTTKQLNDTLADMRRLVQQWEQEGLYLKFSK